MWMYQLPDTLSDEQYDRWKQLLEQRSGISFLGHKSILQAGLRQRMRELGLTDYEAYFEQVSQVPQGLLEWKQLVDRLAVKETQFYRDPQSFAATKTYLEILVDEQGEETAKTLDIWSVGCSTGEEAYSLAMLIKEVLATKARDIFWGITAIDISASAIAQAISGRFAERKLSQLPEVMKAQFFQYQSDGYYQIVADIRERMCFVQGNILELAAAPTIKMDVIYCQNVLIYFSRTRMEAVLNSLVERLKPGGLLMLGAGEASGWRHPLVTRIKNDSVQGYVRIQQDSDANNTALVSN